MQLTKTIFSLALATTALALPTGTMDDSVPNSVKVINNCEFSVYNWLVASDTTDQGVIHPGEQQVNPQLHDPAIGSAIKISTQANSLYTDRPIFHLSYNQVGDMLYYDLSSSGGIDEAWNGQQITLTGTPNDFKTLVWTGTPTGTKAYHGHTDVTLTLCSY